MTEIMKPSKHLIIDYMARDYESYLRSMRALIPQKLPEWKDFESEADFGNVLLQLFAHMGDILSYYQDRIVNESFLGTAQTRSSVIHHLRLIGYNLSTAAPASAILTVKTDHTGTVTINKGDAFATKSQKDKPSVRFEYTRDVPLEISFSSENQVANIPVEEGRLVKDEIIGISDGTPNQRFTLAHPCLILRSLGLGQEVNKDITLISQIGENIDHWSLQYSLAFSREQQKEYVIEIDEKDRATVVFGDGTFGAIPARGSVLRATYRVGGGLLGNVAKDTITTIVNAPQLALIGAEITNSEPASGGSDRESIDHAVMHAPSVFRSLKRAVTAEDYKALALDFNGVGKVRAEATNWNTVKLFVAPQGGGLICGDILKANLLAYFEDKRPLSTIIEIEDADYVKIYISAELGIESYYAREDIKEKVYDAVSSLLAFDNVEFSDKLYLSKFYEAIENIEGVDYVTIKQFTTKEEGTIETDGIIALETNEIPRIPDDPEDNGNYARGIYITSLHGGA